MHRPCWSGPLRLMPPGLSFGSFGTVTNERKGLLMGLDTSNSAVAEAVIAPLAEVLDGGDTDA